MSETPAPRRVLHLIIEGFPADRFEELSRSTNGAGDIAEIFQLTEASAHEALEKIFAADGIAVWGAVS